MKEINIFEVLNANIDKNQEQQNAPDFDFLNVKRLMEGQAPAPAPKPAPKPEPAPKPAPKPEPAPKPAPKPEPVYDLFTAIAQEETEQEVPQPAKKLRRILRYTIPVAAVIVIISFVFGVTVIRTEAMSPLISRGDAVIISKLAKDIREDDIVIFKGSDGMKTAARIVATKGDLVEITDKGELYINNKLQEEDHIHTETPITDNIVSYPVIVDEGKYFVLGDNRMDSEDSRNSSVELLTEDEITGKAIYCFKKIK